MKGIIQLGIPTPCFEHWEHMRPEEKGRYCGACSKTVIDFSMMSDREIIAYLSQAGQNVCGRLAPGQLNRGLALQSGVSKGRRGWWHWLLAGLLVASEADAQRQPLKTGSHQAAGAVLEKILIGDTVMMVPGKNPIKKDSIRVDELPAVVVHGYPLMGRLGGLVVCRVIKCVDSPMQWVRDTLNLLGLRPKKELNVYPNPVRRGSPVMLTWQTMEMGSYEVGLFSSAGALIQRRVMQVSSKDQVDLLEIPSTLSAGVYFLQASSGGNLKPLTRKIVVQ